MPSNLRSKIQSGPVNRSCVSVAAIGSSQSGRRVAVTGRSTARATADPGAGNRSMGTATIGHDRHPATRIVGRGCTRRAQGRARRPRTCEHGSCVRSRRTARPPARRADIGHRNGNPFPIVGSSLPIPQPPCLRSPACPRPIGPLPGSPLCLPFRQLQVSQAAARAAGGARRRLLGAAARRLDRPRRQDRRHLQRDRRRQPADGAASSSASARWSASEGKTRQRVKFGRSSGAWGEMESSVNTLIDDLLWPTTEVTRAHRRGRAGRPAADRAARRRRPAARGRVPALGDHRQHDDQAARRVHLRGDARRARGRHRRQARRPGAGAATSAASGRT